MLRIFCRHWCRPRVNAMRAASLLNSSLCLCAMFGLLDGEHRFQVTGTRLGRIHDQFSNGQRFRMLNLVDGITHE
jgi:hypothetical protein